MKKRTEAAAAPLLAALALAAGPALAVDGVIEINQARAIAGGITPGDAAGFPVLLSQPGSYRLTGNLTLPDTNTGGIQISASSGAVIIDMNGFLILGPGTCGSACPVSPASCTFGTGRGIYSTSAVTGVSVRNGGVEGVGGAGIEIIGGLATDRVYTQGNGGAGFRTIDGAGRFVHSIASRNGGDGFQVDTGYPGIARDVVPSCNGGDGFEAGVGSTVSGSNALTNGGRGFAVGLASNVIGNTTLNNTGVGLECTGTTGYAQNVFQINNGGGAQVSGACAQLGDNLCNGVLCP